MKKHSVLSKGLSRGLISIEPPPLSSLTLIFQTIRSVLEMVAVHRRSNSQRRQSSAKASRTSESDDAMAVDVVDGGPRHRRPPKHHRPRRSSSDFSSVRRSHPVPSIAAYRPGSSMQTRRASSMSRSKNDRPKLGCIQSSGKTVLKVEDEMSICPKSKKVVRFSRYSSIHVYQIHEVEKKKSYNSADLKLFKVQAKRDAQRVTELISTCPCKGGNAVCHLIDIGELAFEELVGIDHLLGCENAERRIAFDRFIHAKLVTKNQHDLSVRQLANIARKRSSKNVEKALMRAELANVEHADDEFNVKSGKPKNAGRLCHNSPAA